MKIKEEMIHILSKIPFLKSKYKTKWKEIKLKKRTSLKKLNKSNMDEAILDLLFYQRVDDFDKPLGVYEYVSNILECQYLHKKSFEDKRFLNFGKDVVICATGPTLEFHETITNAYYIGMNNAYKLPNLYFDALFCQDAYTVFGGKIPQDFLSYRGNSCLKFLGNGQPISSETNPKEFSLFYYMSENRCNYNIACKPLPDFTSVVFSAFMFALWTMPKRIFLVGCDCSTGHASSVKATHNCNCSSLVNNWKKLKSFAKNFYPDIEIISINPKGLKGMFKEVYTKSFLEKYPDVADDNIEFLNINSIANKK